MQLSQWYFIAKLCREDHGPHPVESYHTTPAGRCPATEEQLQKKCCEHNQNLYAAFIDLTKAFHT